VHVSAEDHIQEDLYYIQEDLYYIQEDLYYKSSFNIYKRIFIIRVLLTYLEHAVVSISGVDCLHGPTSGWRLLGILDLVA